MAHAAVVVVVAGGLVAWGAPARAATSAPIAAGGGAATDARVWEIVGTAAASRVRMTPYRVGVSGSNVDNQRWLWERVASSATAGLTWRIKNVASGLCLDKNTANAVVINACGTATSQRWRAPLDDPYGGWTLVNGANSQCLHVVGASTANGALLQTAACSGVAAQRWRLRSAPIDCTIRSRDWTMTEVCASQSSERMRGVTANWRHYPISMTWLDPDLYILTHTVNTYVQVRPLKPDLSPGSTGVEFGSRAERSIEQSGTVSYSAYWLEWNTSTEQYHGLTDAQAPRSRTADGRNHTFTLIGKSDAGQWDLLYDYNTVGTTALQAGGSTRSSRSGMAVRYPQAATTATSFDMRMQLMDLNQLWRRPYLGETGTGEPKTCETPPRYEDWGYDSVNMPPRCFAAAYTTLPGATATDPVQLDAFTVGKPATSTAIASVPQASPASRPMTADQALRAAGRNFGVVGASAKPRVTTKQRGLAADGAEGPVHVVTSTARVRSLAATNDRTYDGYVAVFDSTTGQLISACLGAGCGEES